MGKDKEEGGINFDDFVIGENFEEILNLTGEENKEEVIEDEKEEDKVEDKKEDEIINDDKSGDDGEGDDDPDDKIEEEEEEEEKEEDVEDVTEEDDEESFIPMIEALHQHNGWEFDPENFKDKSINGLMDFVGEVVEANSKPEYASEESARFDEFVRRYGPEKATEYLQANYGEMD
jgi:hypothetical protein